jgi:quinol monooxygenase YgiN
MFTHVNANEPGTLIYALHTDDKDPNVAYFYELYSDKDALVSHGGSDTMKTVGRGLKDLLAGRLEVTMMTPVAAKGIDL